jgi:hypothetical protein
MPGLSKVIVLDPDVRASRQVQLGFAREGVPATIAQIPVDLGRFELPEGEAGLIVVGGNDGRALDLLRRARLLLETHHLDAPIVFAGRGVRRTDAEAAGADEVVLQPAFLRDVVTIGRLLRGQPANQRDHLIGSLAETTGVYTLVRALAALGRSAVLTLIRGLRRGEVRFFHGEVTSAQVGLIHGQAALHQLLLWTEARFDFHHEDVVRRQQIPMTRDELFADAERFLEGVRDSSGRLSPSMVLEQDVARVSMLGKQIPTEVHGVLRMFDGHRVLADVLEDSPYRVFETLRVAQRAVDVGLLKTVDTQRPKATWRAVLAIEEWLVGSDRDEVIARTAAESGPIAKADPVKGGKGSRRKRKKRKAATPIAVPVVTAKPEIDWGALIPRVVGAEVGTLSGVVPAAQTSGEIQTPSREVQREKLEALMDTGRRDLIFPKDIGLEPKVVFDVEAEARAKADADAEARAKAEEQARNDAEAQAKVDADRAATIAAMRSIADSVTADDRATDLVKQLVTDARAEITTPRDAIIVVETPLATVVVQDTMTVRSTENTARLTATPTATVTEAAVPSDAAPVAAVDEPSDGVVRQLSTVDTAPVARRPPPGEVPADDRPEAAKGEISSLRAQLPVAVAVAPEPSILVTDLAAVQSAVAAVVNAQAAAPPSISAATPAHENAVADVRKDAASAAVAFSDAEEAFFRAGQEKATKPPIAAETFDDLDEGYQPVGFWDRLRGKKPAGARSGTDHPPTATSPNSPNKKR